MVEIGITRVIIPCFKEVEKVLEVLWNRDEGVLCF
jgi:hypothetical protein